MAKRPRDHQDTVVCRRRARVGDFVADQPGLTLFHCHIQISHGLRLKALFRSRDAVHDVLLVLEHRCDRQRGVAREDVGGLHLIDIDDRAALRRTTKLPLPS